MVWQIIVVVFITGFIGGLIGGFIDRPSKKELGLWYQGDLCGTHFLGLLGSVLLGGVAAAVFWCLYGPFAGTTIIGDATGKVGLTLGQLASCLVIGMGGPAFLLTESRRRCLKEQLDQFNTI